MLAIHRLRGSIRPCRSARLSSMRPVRRPGESVATGSKEIAKRVCRPAGKSQCEDPDDPLVPCIPEHVEYGKSIKGEKNKSEPPRLRSAWSGLHLAAVGSISPWPVPVLLFILHRALCPPPSSGALPLQSCGTARFSIPTASDHPMPGSGPLRLSTQLL
jgi:hypothetical protein